MPALIFRYCFTVVSVAPGQFYCLLIISIVPKFEDCICRPAKLDPCQFIVVQFSIPKNIPDLNALVKKTLPSATRGAMSVLEPESLRPSEEKIDPTERLEKAKKLKEDGNAKFKAEEQQMVTAAHASIQKAEKVRKSKASILWIYRSWVPNQWFDNCHSISCPISWREDVSVLTARPLYTHKVLHPIFSADNLDWYHSLIDEFVAGLGADKIS